MIIDFLNRFQTPAHWTGFEFFSKFFDPQSIGFENRFGIINHSFYVVQWALQLNEAVNCFVLIIVLFSRFEIWSNINILHKKK